MEKDLDTTKPSYSNHILPDPWPFVYIGGSTAQFKGPKDNGKETVVDLFLEYRTVVREKKLFKP